MSDRETASRRTLVTELLLPDSYALTLATPVLIEAGQAFWVDGEELVVEDETGMQRRFQGSLEPRCY